MLRDTLLAYLQDVVRLMSNTSATPKGWDGLQKQIAQADPAALKAALQELSDVIRRGKSVRQPLFLLSELRRLLAEAAWHLPDAAERHQTCVFGHSLKRLADHGSTEAFGEAVARFLSRTGGVIRVHVQSANELEAEMRQEMLKSIMKKSTELVLPTFRVERALLGGVRIFHGGRLADDTWLGRAQGLIRFTRGRSVV